MIKLLRGSGASIGVWIILGVLALAFGLTFGIPSDGITIGDSAFANAFGEDVRAEDWNYQRNAVQHVVPVPEDQRLAAKAYAREEIFESILERAVYLDVADELGLAADVHDAEMLTRDGSYIVMGESKDWLGDVPFNYDSLFKQRWVPGFSTNEKGYLDRQREEILARTVRDLLAATTVVPESEVRAAYDADVDQLSLRYVRFEAIDYATLVDPTPEEIDAHVQSERETLEKAFESQGPRFTKLPKQWRLRFLKASRPAALAEDADAQAKAAHAAAEAAAKAKIEDARRRLAAGEDFRRVARELSDDAPTAADGGEYGWVSLEGTGSGLEPAVDEAAKELEAGGVSGRIDGEEGYYMVQVVGLREGDVAMEDALRELAEEAVKRERGKALAKQAAEEALLAAKGGKTLAELFPPPGAAVDPSAESDDRPQMQTTGFFRRGGQVPGIGVSPELTKAAWDADPKAEFIDRVFEVPTGFVVAGIDERKQPSDEDYAAQRPKFAAQLALAKSRRVTAHFAKRRCTDAIGQGRLKGDDAQIGRLLTYDFQGDEPAPERVPYRMCDHVGNQGGLLRLQMNLGSAF